MTYLETSEHIAVTSDAVDPAVVEFAVARPGQTRLARATAAGSTPCSSGAVFALARDPAAQRKLFLGARHPAAERARAGAAPGARGGGRRARDGRAAPRRRHGRHRQPARADRRQHDPRLRARERPRDAARPRGLLRRQGALRRRARRRQLRRARGARGRRALGRGRSPRAVLPRASRPRRYPGVPVPPHARRAGARPRHRSPRRRRGHARCAGAERARPRRLRAPPPTAASSSSRAPALTACCLPPPPRGSGLPEAGLPVTPALTLAEGASAPQVDFQWNWLAAVDATVAVQDADGLLARAGARACRGGAARGGHLHDHAAPAANRSGCPRRAPCGSISRAAATAWPASVSVPRGNYTVMVAPGTSSDGAITQATLALEDTSPRTLRLARKARLAGQLSGACDLRRPALPPPPISAPTSPFRPRSPRPPPTAPSRAPRLGAPRHPPPSPAPARRSRAPSSARAPSRPPSSCCARRSPHASASSAAW